MSLPAHHAVKLEGGRTIYVCAKCLVLWPCREAHRAVTRCVICGRLWSEHSEAEYRGGCKARVTA